MATEDDPNNNWKKEIDDYGASSDGEGISGEESLYHNDGKLGIEAEVKERDEKENAYQGEGFKDYDRN